MNGNTPNPNLSESDLLEFALRLATYPNDPSTQNAQILPGHIPDQLPVEIPIPEDSRILGSLIRNPESIDILFNAHLSSEQVLSFYRKIMEAKGWQTTDVYRPNRGGFMPSGSRSQGGNETYYLGLRDPSLTVNAYPGKGNMTDIKLNLNMNGPLPPGPLPHMRGGPSRNIFSLLPALEAPEGQIKWEAVVVVAVTALTLKQPLKQISISRLWLLIIKGT